MDFRVSDICQTASGGSYVVKFRVDMDLHDSESGVKIELISVNPDDADPQMVQQSLEFIRRGATSVLEPRQAGALLRIYDLIIHDVDCKPCKFEQPTALAIIQALAAVDESRQ